MRILRDDLFASICFFFSWFLNARVALLKAVFFVSKIFSRSALEKPHVAIRSTIASYSDLDVGIPYSSSLGGVGVSVGRVSIG